MMFAGEKRCGSLTSSVTSELRYQLAPSRPSTRALLDECAIMAPPSANIEFVAADRVRGPVLRRLPHRLFKRRVSSLGHWFLPYLETSVSCFNAGRS